MGRYACHALYDLDDMISESEEMPVVDIFEKRGGLFPDERNRCIAQYAGLRSCRHCLRGGAACFNQNINWMNEHGITVYLSASPPFLLDRIMDEKDKEAFAKKDQPSRTAFSYNRN